MSLWLRLFWVFFQSFFKSRLGIVDASTISLVSFPNDLDIYGHMNNGRYLTLMDLGRIDLIIRTGLGKVAQKNHWAPLVGTVNIQYRKSLTVFQTFQIRTRILGWDEKWFYIEQTFWRRRKIVARAMVQGLFRGADGNVPAETVLRAVGCSQPSPSLSKTILGQGP